MKSYIWTIALWIGVAVMAAAQPANNPGLGGAKVRKAEGRWALRVRPPWDHRRTRCLKPSTRTGMASLQPKNSAERSLCSRNSTSTKTGRSPWSRFTAGDPGGPNGGPLGGPGNVNGPAGGVAPGRGRQTPQQRQMAGQFMQYDRNGDGKLSPQELPQQGRAMLQGADLNGDDMIDAAELQMAVRRMGERIEAGRRLNGQQPPVPAHSRVCRRSPSRISRFVFRITRPPPGAPTILSSGGVSV